MKITREKHSLYMSRLAPLLFLAVVIQSYLYFKFFPAHLAQDITVFLGVGVALILAFFMAHNHFHQVEFRPNYLEIRIPPLKYKEEILYAHIVDMEVKRTRFGFGNVKLYLKDEDVMKIFYVDNAEGFVQMIREKQGHRAVA